MTQYPLRRRTRLDPAAYANVATICSITICTNRRAPFFRNSDLAQACVDLLLGETKAYSTPLYAYCLMPDHLHLLLSPSPQASIIDFVREFKGRSTRLGWQYNISGKLWQQGFYDHFLRRDEDVEKVMQYILENPVRKGLVEWWQKYLFAGVGIPRD